MNDVPPPKPLGPKLRAVSAALDRLARASHEKPSEAGKSAQPATTRSDRRRDFGDDAPVLTTPAIEQQPEPSPADGRDAVNPAWERAARIVVSVLDADPSDSRNRDLVVAALDDPTEISDAELGGFIIWLFDDWGRSLDVGCPPELLELAVRRRRAARAAELREDAQEERKAELLHDLAGINPLESPELVLRRVDELREAFRATVQPRGPQPLAFRRPGEMELRPPEWLIRKLIERDQVLVVFGDPGAGKSFLTIDWGLSIATGQPFAGLETKQGVVLYIAGEGQRGIKGRIAAWSIRHQVNVDEVPFLVSLQPYELLDERSVEELINRIEAVAEAHGPPVLIIFDTLARNFGGGDENSTADMMAVIRAADRMRARWRSAMMFTHHAGHSDKSRSRGASALYCALDSEFRLDKDQDGIVRLEATKTKDGEFPQPLAFKIVSVELGIQDEKGEEITSAVLEPQEYEPPSSRTTQQTADGKWQVLGLTLLRDLEVEHRRNVEASGRDPAAARVSFDAWRTECRGRGMPRNRFADVRTTLSAAGLIDVEGCHVASRGGET